MKPTKLLTVSALALLAAAVFAHQAVPAFAQGSGYGPGMGYGPGSGMGPCFRAEMEPGRPDFPDDAALGAIRDDLMLTPDQAKAWEEFAEEYREFRNERAAFHAAVPRAKDMDATRADLQMRRDRHHAGMMEQRAELMEKRAALDAVLSADQRRKLNAAVPCPR